MHDNDTYIHWLSRISGLGSRKIFSIMEYFPDLEEVFTAPREKLKNINGLSDQNIHNIISNRGDLLLKYKSGLDELGIKFITINNPGYPALLKEIYDPPACFYMLGEMPCDTLPKLSIIGSRRCSEYGLTVSRKLAKELAPYNIIIVSGMAKGIDASAHNGTLEGGGKTVAVLGCGVDICYPAENRLLREQIIKNGCVISEYPPGTKPMPSHFPIRNRIISGLSVATVVVEAAEKSGTLITVGQALEQGREVFAIPGNVTSKLSRGTNSLIKQGAALVENYLDILHLLNIEEKRKPEQKTRPKADLKPEEQKILNFIEEEPISVADIINLSKSTASEVQYILTMLEINGLIQKLPGQRYIRM